VLAAALGFPAAAQAAPPREFFGLYPWNYPSDAEAARIGQAGVGTLRATFTWRLVEPTPGARNWDEYDFMVARAAANGTTVLPILIGSPAFVSRRDTNPPRSRADVRRFLDFAKDVVRRYGRHGTFWAARPGLARHPIRAVQVWNETNFPVYWFGRPNARQYARFLAVTARAVRSVDRRVKIVLGGLAETKRGPSIARYLNDLYRVRGFRRSVDVIAIQPYARNRRGVEGSLIRTRAIMRAHRDARTPVWITELGWATGGPRGAFVTSVGGQVDRLRSTLSMLIGKRSRYRLRMVVWFSFRDRTLGHGERDWWAPHTGLFDVAGHAKPAWHAFTSLTGGNPGAGQLP
jgi:hypothetical protein